MKDEEQACRICCSADLKCIEAFGSMPRVTSDCVPFKRGGKLAVCVRCGTAQALADEQWFAEIAEIYGKYDIYNQSRGVEQHVFDPVGGSLRPRSEVILERLSEGSNIPLCGKVLDVGCGTGGTLRAFAGHGKWTSYALELDDRNLASLEAIRGFRTLYNCTPAQVPEQFDIITLIHSLEHFPDPYSTLVDLLGKLHHEGSLFIEVPNAADNPFDYMVADHRVHFTKETLTYLVQRSGFSVQLVATDWVSKEISLVAVRSSGTELRVDLPTRNSHLDVIEQVDWLKDFIDCARKAAAGPAPFGLFGTAIAATWLWPAVSERVQFFVEEDPNRIGRTHMGRPILSPAQAPSGAVVFLALVPSIASSIRERLKYLPIDFRTPPRMP